MKSKLRNWITPYAIVTSFSFLRSWISLIERYTYHVIIKYQLQMYYGMIPWLLSWRFWMDANWKIELSWVCMKRNLRNWIAIHSLVTSFSFLQHWTSLIERYRYQISHVYHLLFQILMGSRPDEWLKQSIWLILPWRRSKRVTETNDLIDSRQANRIENF